MTNALRLWQLIASQMKLMSPFRSKLIHSIQQSTSISLVLLFYQVNSILYWWLYYSKLEYVIFGFIPAHFFILFFNLFIASSTQDRRANHFKSYESYISNNRVLNSSVEEWKRNERVGENLFDDENELDNEGYYDSNLSHLD